MMILNDIDLILLHVLYIIPSSVDLVISCLGLHWTNDLPGAMIQVNFLIQIHVAIHVLIAFICISLHCFLLVSQKDRQMMLH
jgi:hypothetical protein